LARKKAENQEGVAKKRALDAEISAADAASQLAEIKVLRVWEVYERFGEQKPERVLDASNEVARFLKECSLKLPKGSSPESLKALALIRKRLKGVEAAILNLTEKLLNDRLAASSKLVLGSALVSIYTIAISPDSKQLIAGTKSGLMIQWDLSSGKAIRRFSGHCEAIYSCDISPDRTRLVSGSHDKTVRIWNLKTGELLHTFEGFQEAVFTCVFSPSGKQILTATLDESTVQLWDCQTEKLIRTLEVDRSDGSNCTFSPNGRHVLTASQDKTIRLWD
jgi:WD40 repeat protein